MRWIGATRLVALTGRVNTGGRLMIARAMLGQSTVEYALVGALVVIAAAGALTALGGELTAVFTNISKTLGAAAGH